MRQFDPIFFTPPPVRGRYPNGLHKGGGGGGDGGAAQRKAEEDARVTAGVQRINDIFGSSTAKANAISKDQYWSDYKAPGTTAAPAQSNFMGGFANNNGGSGWLNQNSGMNSYLGGGYNSASRPPPRTFNQAGYDQAVANEQSRVDTINGTAAKREQLYSKIGDDFKNNALTDLNRDYGVASREQNFTLARAGLSGGSRDVDSNKDLYDRQQQGVLSASNQGIQASNNARSADDRTKSDLISSIHAGLTADSAVQQAYEGMSNNARSAQDSANVASMSGFFDAIKQAQQQQAYQAGYNQNASAQQKQNYQFPSITDFNGKVK